MWALISAALSLPEKAQIPELFKHLLAETERCRFIWAQLSRAKTNVKQLRKQLQLAIPTKMTGFPQAFQFSLPPSANPPGKLILGNTNRSLPCFTWVVCWRAALAWSQMLERAALGEERHYSSAGGESPGAQWLGWGLSLPLALREFPVRKTQHNWMFNFTKTDRNPPKEALKRPSPLSLCCHQTCWMKNLDYQEEKNLPVMDPHS